jgi:hypothetical protein
MVVLGLVPASPAHATVDEPATGAAQAGPYLGALLDWATDTTANHAERLGAPAALYARSVTLPMGEQERGFLRGYFGQVTAQGAHALLTIRPEVPLDQVDEEQASALAEQVAELAEGYRGTIVVSFAPQMNASWTTWGQRPEAYTEAFRTVASAMDAALTDPVMVWAPTAAEDYPFRASSTAAPDGGPLGALDTTGDGVWDQDDDAYSPFYPGDDVVDWVGLIAYHDETGKGPGDDVVPDDGKLAALLGPARADGPEEDADGPSDDQDFYATYAEGRDKPLLIETAALYSPGGVDGPSERDVKGAWWEQVLAAASGDDYDRIQAVVWNETVEQRDGGAVTVDWRVTADERLAAAFAEDLDGSVLVTGPVVEPARLAGAASPASGTVLRDGVALAAAASVLVVALLLCLLSRLPTVRAVAYTGTSSRDARIDMLRGMAIVFVVINHVGLTSLFQLLTQETIGVVSGAELFVLLSGAVVGLVYGPRVVDAFPDVLQRTSRRAWKLYVTALVVVLLVYLVSRLPLLDAQAVTTFTDQGTGAAGAGAAGTTYELYAGLEGLTQFPLPPQVVPSLFLLQVGPWQFNVMGLYVILLAVSPLILVALSRGRAWLVLGISLVLYAVGAATRFRLLPSQFEDSFPLLVWQVLFVLGMVAGYHRATIVSWFAAPRRRVLLWACVLLTVVFALFSWSSPYFSNEYDVRLALLPDATFRTVYDRWFERTYLGIGRLVNVLLVVVTGYALLSAFWEVLERALGCFLIPLGQPTLSVLIVHVFLVVAAADIPVLQRGDIWLNSAAYVVILGVLWLMVRSRFLFRVIPR